MTSGVTAELVRCIYCSEHRPPSREHILQRGIGGNLQFDAVCDECNRGFSNIDQALAERSLVALSRLKTPPDTKVQLGGDSFFFNKEHELWQDVRVINGPRAVAMPQLHQRGERFHFFADSSQSRDRFIDLLDGLVRVGGLGGIFIKEGPPNRCDTPRIVLYRRKEFYIRATDASTGQRFVDWLGAKWEKIRLNLLNASLPIKQIRPDIVWHHMGIVFDDIYRAVAKIAYEVLAYYHGAEFVLRPEFEPFRDYIRGLSIVHPDPLPAESIAVDTRFVRDMDMVSVEKPPYLTDGHLVQFSYIHGHLISTVTLYRNHTFMINCAEIELNPYGGYFFGHEFSIDRSHNQEVEVEELARRKQECKRQPAKTPLVG